MESRIHTPLRLLLVEDSDDDASILELQLRHSGFEPVSQRVETRSELQSALEASTWDIVICDYRLPQFDAGVALDTVRNATRDLPFIVVSGEIDDETAVSLMERGAQDYLLKDNLSRLGAAVRREVGQAELRKDRQSTRSRMLQLEITDPLTQLSNRDHFSVELERFLAAARDHEDVSLTLAVIDVDDLRLVNDTYGYGVGDRVLIAVANVTRRFSQAGLAAARIGDGRFAVAPSDAGPADVTEWAQQLCRECAESALSVDDLNISITCSAGVVRYPEDGQSAADLLSRAELALRDAKTRGKGSVAVFNPAIGQRAETFELQMVRNLVTEAIAHDRILLMLQPICSVSDEEPEHWEVLTRLFDARGDVRTPDEFIPQAEKLGLVQALDREIVEQAFKAWRAAADEDNRLRIAINLSALCINRQMVEYVVASASRWRVPPEYVTVEITETATVEDENAVREFTAALSDAGFRLAMDDFGSGSSSLLRVRDLRFDILKLDGSLVEDLVKDENHRQFVGSLITFAHRQDLEVVAECVEDEATLEVLKQLHADYAQGFYLGKPVEFASVTFGHRS